MQIPQNDDQARELLSQGLAHVRDGSFDKAFKIFNALIESRLLLSEALYQIAGLEFKQGKYRKAAEYYESLLHLEDHNDLAHTDYAGALLNLRKPEQALEHADKALALNSGRPRTHNTRGAALLNLLRPQDAFPSLVKAIELKPDYVSAINNLGTYYRITNQSEQAIIWFTRALSLDPANVEANFSRSITYLKTGNFREGFAAYEWRFRREDMKHGLRHHEQSRWIGQLNLAGLAILLQCEQGLGDSIQFSRYAIALANRGAKVILEVPASLQALFGCLEPHVSIIREGESLPQFTCHSPLMSLPFACGTTLQSIPAATKYLSAPRDRTVALESMIGKKQRPRVGIVWRGQPHHSNDRARSINLEQFPIPDTNRFEVFSIQYAITDAEAGVLESRGVKQLGCHFNDMADTAAALEQMDLVISVDTSVAHLAGALGRPTWVLLAYDSDWRWLEGRTDSPWYPTMRLFRQRAFSDWNGVFDDVDRALSEFTAQGAESGNAAP